MVANGRVQGLQWGQDCQRPVSAVFSRITYCESEEVKMLVGRSLKKPLFLCLFLILPILFLTQRLLQPTATARGKSAAMPLTDRQTPEQALAQELALADSLVQAHTVGRRSEVFGVRTVGGQYTAASAACASADCRQVEIYDFDDDAAVIAIVNVETREVLDVLRQPGVHPGINKRLNDLALDIASNHPDVIAALGYRPIAADLAPVDAGLTNTACSQGHLCVAPNFQTEDQTLWAVVDLTEERLAGLNWTEIGDESAASGAPFIPDGGCPPDGSVTRDGWDLDYETTGTDGLRVYDVTYNGNLVLSSVKLVEWHADYGSSGYEDSTGCGGGGGGFPIYPYGNTQVLDIEDDESNVIGFEVVQDFRMGNWGFSCNYRYEQRIQFYNDGRFRTVSGAYGKGCGTNSLYRPIVRVDIGVDSIGNDSFAIWDGSNWDTETNEGWWSQDAPYTEDGYKWRVTDENGNGYYLEPGQGQFGDGGEGDYAFIYAVQHHANEGDTDLGVIGDCCGDDYQQGPDNYLNNEDIEKENIVVWYVPQMLTDASGPDYYCWTVSGEPNPETYPCFAGPMFVPINQGGVAPLASFSHEAMAEVGETVVFSNTTTGTEPIEYTWDFGDGSESSSETNPGHAYEAAGSFTVTLTAGNQFATDTAASAITIVDAMAVVEPGAGSTLVYTDTAGHEATLVIPAGAVTETTTLVFNALDGATPPKFHLFGGLAFSLDAYQNGVLVPGFVFEQPLQVTLNYSDEDVVGIIEETLALYYWDGSVWVDASTTCNPASTYVRNADENWISVAICHLTDFAIFGEPVVPLNYFYVPAIVNN